MFKCMPFSNCVVQIGLCYILQATMGGGKFVSQLQSPVSMKFYSSACDSPTHNNMSKCCYLSIVYAQNDENWFNIRIAILADPASIK